METRRFKDDPSPESDSSDAQDALAAAPGLEVATKGSRFGRRRDHDAQVAEALHQLAAGLQLEHGSARWSGRVGLSRRQTGLVLTFQNGFALIFTDEDRQQAVFVPAKEITWLKLGRRGILIGLVGHQEIAARGQLVVHEHDLGLFEALTSIPRPASEGSLVRRQPQISVRPGPSESKLAVPHRAEGRRTENNGDCAAISNPGFSVIGRLATMFTPTAYVEHPDGVMRPCFWTGEGVPPGVGAALHLTEDDRGGWRASLKAGAS